MERVCFERTVVTVLRLTKDEVLQLTAACEAHYDGGVQALSRAGEDGILYMARVRLDHGDEEGGKDYADIRVTSRQLDTLCKAVEAWHSPFFQLSGGDLRPSMTLRQLHREANDEWVRLNPETVEKVNEIRRKNGAPPLKV